MTRPVCFLQTIAWGLLVISAVSALGGRTIAHSVEASIATAAARFTHALEIGAAR